MSTNNEDKCYMAIKHISSSYSLIELPSYPDEISDSISVNWSDQTIVNRPSPITSYVNTGYRSVSFTITLHREMNGSVNKILRSLRACVYPMYSASTIKPPIVFFQFGKEFKTKGIMRSLSYQWKKPIIDGKYYLCDVSIQLDEPLENISNITAEHIMYNEPGDPFRSVAGSPSKTPYTGYSNRGHIPMEK